MQTQKLYFENTRICVYVHTSACVGGGGGKKFAVVEGKQWSYVKVHFIWLISVLTYFLMAASFVRMTLKQGFKKLRIMAKRFHGYCFDYANEFYHWFYC